MDWFTGVILYLLIWWTALFAVLPWGLNRPYIPETGHQAGSPVNPRIRLKFLVTTLLAAMIWLLVFILIQMDIIDFRALATGMMEKGLTE